MVQVVTNENIQEFIQNRQVPEFQAPEAPKAEAEAPKADAPAEPPAEKPRDESGKFAPKEAAEAADTSQDDDDTTALSEPIKKKIDKLIAKKHRAMKEAEEFGRDEARRALAAEARAAELQRQVDELTKKPEKSEGPAPDGEPKPEDFKTVGEYAKALTKWEVDKARKADKAQSEQSTKKQQVDAEMAEFAKRVKAAAEKVSDYGEVVSSVDVVIPDHIGSYIVQSEHGPMMGYMLAKNRGELDRVMKLPPIKALAEIGKLEDKWFAKASEPAATKAPEVSKAPPPIQPLEGRSSPVVKDPKDMNFKELRELREQEKKVGKVRY